MLALLLKILVLLVVLTSALIGVVHSQSNDDALLQTLIVPNCDSPCWQGIRVGVTTRQEATAILEASPWVDQVFQTPIVVTWRWNGKEPALIDGARDGLLQLAGNTVSEIRIQTRIPFGAVWLLLDRPDDARLVQPLTRLSAYQIAAYETVGVETMSTFNCPATPAVFWGATITLGLGKIWPMEALNSHDFNIYHAPEWWRHLRNC